MSTVQAKAYLKTKNMNVKNYVKCKNLSTMSSGVSLSVKGAQHECLMDNACIGYNGWMQLVKWIIPWQIQTVIRLASGLSWLPPTRRHSLFKPVWVQSFLQGTASGSRHTSYHGTLDRQWWEKNSVSAATKPAAACARALRVDEVWKRSILECFYTYENASLQGNGYI